MSQTAFGNGSGEVRTKLGLRQPSENDQIQSCFDAGTLRSMVDVMYRQELPLPPVEVVDNIRRAVHDLIARAAVVLDRLCVDEEWFQDT